MYPPTPASQLGKRVQGEVLHPGLPGAVLLWQGRRLQAAFFA